MTKKIDQLVAAANDALRRGDAASAAARYREALALDGSNDRLRVAYARAAGAAGQLAESSAAALEVLSRSPENEGALGVASAAAFARGQWSGVVELAPRWLQAGGNRSRAARFLSHAWVELGEPGLARDAFRMIVEDAPRVADHWATYARLCLGAFDYAQAQHAIERAHALAPPTATSLYAKGRLDYFLGRLDEAAANCRSAVARDPAFAPAYALLTTVSRGDVDDETAQAMDALAARSGANALVPSQRASLLFALGDIRHRRADYPGAMQCYQQANALTEQMLEARGAGWCAARLHERAAQCAALFASLPPPLAGLAPSAPRPLFVVGMPRSGTTLVESILAAHESVHGAGELSTMPRLLQELLAWSAAQGGAPLSALPHDRLAALRERYLAELPRAEGAVHVVDKQPFNLWSVPLIRVLFPDAPIVHVRREPVDVAFSIFRNDFAGTWNFATSFDAIAQVYGAAERWLEQFAQDCAPVDYERLVTDFEGQARRLLAICALPWRDACLAFHEVRRPVATFSAAQVREPMRRTVVSAAGQYGALLDPLRAALRRHRVGAGTGP